MPRARWLITLLFLNAATGAVLGAQTRSRTFVDVTLGGTAIVGNEPFNGEYYRHNGNMLFLVTFGLQPEVSRPLVASLELGFLGLTLGDDSCRITPLGGCARQYPFAGVIAVMAGGRPIQSPFRFVEVTAGPALIGQDGRGTPVGILAKARIGSPPGTYLSPGISLYAVGKVVNDSPLFGVGAGVSLRTW
jgi:hypothetical protein